MATVALTPCLCPEGADFLSTALLSLLIPVPGAPSAPSWLGRSHPGGPPCPRDSARGTRTPSAVPEASACYRAHPSLGKESHTLVLEATPRPAAAPGNLSHVTPADSEARARVGGCLSPRHAWRSHGASHRWAPRHDLYSIRGSHQHGFHTIDFWSVSNPTWRPVSLRGECCVYIIKCSANIFILRRSL